MPVESALLKPNDMPRRASPTLAVLHLHEWDLETVAGEGESAIVWRGRDRATGAAGAIKIAKRPEVVLREAELVGRVGRRWGPALLGAGRMPNGVVDGVAGAATLGAAVRAG